MRPRILVSAFATMAALALTAACGAPGTSDNAGTPTDVDLSSPDVKEGTLTIVTKFADPKYAPYFEKIAADYEAANPDVNVDLQQVGDQPYKDKIRVLAASDELPDIYFSWAGDFANKFVRAGLATDLSDVLAPDTDWGSTFSPAALRAFESDGKYYGVPINLDAKYMAYNTKIFDELGLEIPKTVDDLISACQTLDGAGYTPIGFGNQYGWPAIHYITQLNAYNVPTDVRDADYNPATGEFTDPGYEAALTQFADIADACFVDGTNGLSHEAGQAEFLSSEAGMHYLESVEFQVLTADGGAPADVADNWSFFRLPAPADAAGDTSAITGAPDGFMVNAMSEHAALAVDYLKFMTSQENGAAMVEDLGWLSAVQGTATADNSFPQLEDALADISDASDFAIWLDTVTNAEVANAYLAGVQGILDGSKDPASVMEDVRDAAAKAQEQVS